MSKKEMEPTKVTPKFTKQQFLQTRQRSGADKDILSVVLDDSKTYTIAEAERLIADFKKRKVK